jgi:uncharacterized protein YwqG
MSKEITFPVEFERLRLLWKDIKKNIADIGNLDECAAIESGLQSASWAWEPNFQRSLPEDVDRKGEVLLGPFFSSIENPWPSNDGLPMIPLAQLDLDKASSLGGVDLGSGLLQLFCSITDNLGQDVYSRVIARSEVANQTLTPVPRFPDDINGFASVAWAQTNSRYRKSDGGTCIQITGYTRKRFTLWMPSPIAETINLQAVDIQSQEKIRQFDKLVLDHSDEWSPGGFHLFGTFYPIQYYPSDRDSVLFTLESEHGFNFGDGQAQIFYKFYRDHPEWGAGFSFEWACY